MDRFIELTSVRHDQKIIINSSQIVMILPSHIGCDILLRGSEDRPVPVTEEYQELKDLLVER